MRRLGKILLGLILLLVLSFGSLWLLPDSVAGKHRYQARAWLQDRLMDDWGETGNAIKGGLITRWLLRNPAERCRQIGALLSVEEGLADCIAAAEGGNVAAQYELAQHYHRAFAIDFDKQQAVHWYRLAAEGGHPRAILQMASINHAGHLGQPRDLQAALHWYDRYYSDNGARPAEYPGRETLVADLEATRQQ